MTAKEDRIMNKPKMSLKLIKIIVGIACGVIVVAVTLGVMLGSYGNWEAITTG